MADSWEQAAKGKVPLVVATFITNFAFAAFEETEQRLKTSCGASNPETLNITFTNLQQKLGLKTDDGGHSNSSVERLIDSLQRSWHLLVEMKGQSPAEWHQRTMSRLPSQLLLRQGNDSASTDRECLSVILHNIGTHVQANYSKNTIMRMGTPVYPEIGDFLIHDEKNGDNNGLRSSFGLQLLLESYKSYLFAAGPTYNPSNCRLQALKFAQTAITSITAVLDDSTMPCKCPGTLAYHLENIHKDFTVFLEARVFDFYFQSPWVSGSHVLEMLEALFYYGVRLFSYRNYVGSLLHAYNVLRQFTEFPSIPLLEMLCSKPADITFPGGRPTRNFKTCYVRSIGGRLRFNIHTSDHRGCHSMVIPSHVAKATAGFGLRKNAHDPRFDYSKISLFHHIKERGYHLDNATWERIHNLDSKTDERGAPHRKDKKARSCSHHSHSSDNLTSCHPTHRLQTLQNVLLDDFTGPLPIARLNFLEVYLACVRTISLVSDRYHGNKAHPGQNCLCFVDALLAAADQCRDGEWKVFGCKELVEICREVMGMEGGLGGKEVEDFLWKGF